MDASHSRLHQIYRDVRSLILQSGSRWIRWRESRLAYREYAAWLLQRSPGSFALRNDAIHASGVVGRGTDGRHQSSHPQSTLQRTQQNRHTGCGYAVMTGR